MNTRQKNEVLNTLAKLLFERQEEIIQVNQQDILACGENDASMLDRLKVDENKIMGMISALKHSLKLEDPEGKVLSSFRHENGLKIENRAVPFGRILIIYESRPDVTVEAAAMAFKAGNRILLKGGSEARLTNQFLVKLWQEALESEGIDLDYVVYLDLSREETQKLIQENSHKVDLIIPRGGEGLIKYIRSNTDLPLMISGRGNNFLYIDKDCDFKMAVSIILNGKSRLSVCNALDKVLIHQSLEEEKAGLLARLKEAGIEILEQADEQMMKQEFLAAKILVKTVDGLDEAISVINRYSGGHSASIVTSDRQAAERFQKEVDCAAVYHNASTRFTDGGQFGMGAEIAISTQKLHARGPVGTAELVTNKWFIDGSGQIRE